ncbi:hypothetical protein QTJ16_006727 [Diplocarpon rosae]|uniref:Nitrogen regulatory protein areA GATA-like domain-containing protein n=1 Tax=Diplocarpon rosae TaxID=946125 RepID=A0AAD9WBC5_9HELO|nr:hypothetical protein QTJ16_006727 [Diplocarpon rosae]PBP16433.1 hypothetical protein BUE80_DR012764 [Diplocarpon rosae]
MAMALILPKGIVVNSDQINENINRIAAKPLDQEDIARVWKVYTTTKRRLLDPTAERLENYWWRIWYSDRKYLDATTIARLFAHISDGPTFLPLRGPPNRVEGATKNTRVQHEPRASSAAAPQQPSTGMTTATSSSKTASKSPAPMPHPILKKTRGPSTSGPRPTARFISPHESEHEGHTSSISPNSHVVVQPPSPDLRDAKPEKKGGGTSSKKKPGFSASKKKRPVIVRRQSSQTSQSSVENAARDAEAQAATGARSSLEAPPAKIQSRFQEKFSLSPEKSVKNQSTKKRAGDSKRTSPRKPSLSKASSVKSRVRPSQLYGVAVSTGDPGPSTQSGRIQKKPEHPIEKVQLVPEKGEELEMQRILLAEANARAQSKGKQERERPQDPGSEHFQVLHKSLRSKSAGNISSSEGMEAIRLIHNGPKGAPCLAPTLADATGRVDIGICELNTVQLSATPVQEEKGKGKEGEESRQADMFAKIHVQPVQAAPAADPLSRSKSQLTLLLRQDKEKTSKIKHESEKGKNKN